MKTDLLEIQHGWGVYEPAGGHIGDVVAIESGTIHVKTDGFFSKDLYIPPSAIADVESNRVELNVPKNDLNGRGWERPPG